MKGRPRKYQPPQQHLAAQPADRDRLTLSFNEIAQLVGAPLPPGAYLRDWWSNSPRARVHTGHGWRPAGVSRVERLVSALPRGAFTRRWWSNSVGMHGPAWAWLSAG